MNELSNLSSPKRISTGIGGLDALLQGGFLPGRSYLVSGEAGSGKTTACLHFLLAGLKNSEKSVYVTVDEKPAEILQSAASLNWNLQSYVQDKSLVILDASPYFTGRATAIGEKEIDLPRFVTELGEYANKMSATRLAIDPMTPLVVPRDSSAHIQTNTRALIHLLQAHLPTTNLLTAQIANSANHDSTIEEFITAGVIVLSTNTNKDRLVRTLRIKKMRATAVDPSEYFFTIAKSEGIALISPEQKPLVQRETLKGLEFFELPRE